MRPAIGHGVGQCDGEDRVFSRQKHIRESPQTVHYGYQSLNCGMNEAGAQFSYNYRALGKHMLLPQSPPLA